MSATAEVLNLPMSFLIWGHHLAGDVLERTAILAECRPGDHVPALNGPMWDWDEGYLRSVVLKGARPPEWMALPWAGEHIRRGCEPYPEKGQA